MAEAVQKSPLPDDIELVEVVDAQEPVSYTREEEKRYDGFALLRRRSRQHV